MNTRYRLFSIPIFILILFFLSAGTNDYIRAKKYLDDFNILVKKCENNQVQIYAPQLFKKIKEYQKYANLSFSSKRYKTTIGYVIKGRELAENALRIADNKAKKDAQVLLTNFYGDAKVKIAYTNKTVFAYKNMKLAPKDEIITPKNAIATLLIENIGVIYLEANSRLKLQKIKKDERYFTYDIALQLLEGSVRVKLTNFNFNESLFRIVAEPYTIIARSKYFIVSEKGIIENFGDQLYITDETETYTLKSMQGFSNKKIVEITPPPKPLYPKEVEIKTRRTLFRWGKVSAALRYRVEISRDKIFYKPLRVIISSKPQTEVKDLKDGQYFWRVRAIYKYGVYSDWSEVARFYVKQDTIPPRLEVYTPYDGEVLNREYVYVSGRTEPLARVSINQYSLRADTYGDFAKGIILDQGIHIVRVRAYDRNDNITEKAIIVTVDYSPPPLFIKNKIPEFTNEKILHIEGTTERGALLTVNKDTMPVVDGNFSINYILKEGGNEIHLIAKDRAGNYTTKTLYVILDATPPFLAIDTPPINTETMPIYFNKSVKIEGRCEPHIKIVINNDTLWTGKSSTFSYTFFASEGINIVKVTAVDSASNKVDSYVVFLVDTSKDKLILKNGTIIFKKSKFRLSGFTYPNKTILVNNYVFKADNKGRFAGEVILKDGVTKVNLVIK